MDFQFLTLERRDGVATITLNRPDALSGDLVVAAESARFTMAYSKIVATPDGSSSYFLPRLVGLRRAMELYFTNRVLSAREALEWGLVTRVVPDAELATAVTALAHE